MYGDGGVFELTDLCTKLEKGTINIPPDRMVGSEELPHVFVADDAFALRKIFMRLIKTTRFSITAYLGLDE